MDACTVMKREKRHNASGISNEGMQFLAMLPKQLDLRCQINYIYRRSNVVLTTFELTVTFLVGVMIEK